MSDEKDIFKKICSIENEIGNIKQILLITNILSIENEIKTYSSNDRNLIWFYLNDKNRILCELKDKGLGKLRSIIKENFDKPYSYLLYEKSDGTKTTRDLANEFTISHVTIASYWDKWTELGIMEKISVKGGGSRGKKLFSLSEIGITESEVND